MQEFSPWELYFDNAATTRLEPVAAEAMKPYWSDEFGNADSIHSMGIRSRSAVEKAAQTIAELIGAEDPSQITFTSGATEANNTALFQTHDPIAVSAYEHSSIRVPGKAIGASVFTSPEELQDPNIPFLSWMHVCNETGAKFDLKDLSTRAQVFHSDITQSALKYPVELDTLDIASFSAHKFHGPKGIGVFYSKSGHLEAWMKGGTQQDGRRSGTIPTPLIVGMAAAAQVASDHLETFAEHARACRNELLEGIKHISDVHCNDSASQAPHILSLSFLGVEAESLLIDLDREGISVGTGSACSSRSHELNPVLSAMKIDEVWQRGTIRFSFSKYNSLASTQYLAKKLSASLEKLRAKASKL